MQNGADTKTALAAHVARRLVLVQAIEAADSDGKLLGLAERQAIDMQVTKIAQAAALADQAVPVESLLDMRAAGILQAVAKGHPALAALQEPGAWQRWLAVAVPVAALLLGAATDRIANPHRVDLLSLPLLAIIAWNLVAYAVLLVNALRLGGRAPQATLTALQGWAGGLRPQRSRAGPGSERVVAQVVAQFQWRWHMATLDLQAQRLRRVLHLAAAGWGAGVALSLLARGLVVEYRAGWESTFLSAEQVHAILGVLLAPVVALSGFAPFSVAEIAGLRFEGSGGGAAAGARWVLLYTGLLLIVVIVPRLALAAWAFWREKALARAVPLDLAEPYFQRLVALLTPTRLLLCLLGDGGGRAALLRILRQDGMPATQPLLRTEQGDSLRLVEAGADGRDDSDVLLRVQGDAVEIRGRADGPGAQRLAIADFARCWVQEKLLLEAIGRCVPMAKTEGYARLAAAWEARNLARLQASMTTIALQLLEAARESQELAAPPMSVTSLVNPAGRQANDEARRGAMAQVSGRLQRAAALTQLRLQSLHGIAPEAAGDIAHALEDNFVVQQRVNTSQAGMAGAASGAAMGASVDLLVGGLTLGAAAALGALVGGGAAFIAAAWKNKATPAGASTVQLSDAMLQALVEAGLLRYLAVAHFGRGAQEDAVAVQPAWRSEVVAQVEAERERLAPLWLAARSESAAPELAAALSGVLEGMALRILATLYPRP